MVVDNIIIVRVTVSLAGLRKGTYVVLASSCFQRCTTLLTAAVFRALLLWAAWDFHDHGLKTTSMGRYCTRTIPGISGVF